MKDKPVIVKKIELYVKLYDLIDEAVEGGVNYGWDRGHKHTMTPDEDTVKDCIHREVMNALCNLIDFEKSV